MPGRAFRITLLVVALLSLASTTSAAPAGGAVVRSSELAARTADGSGRLSISFAGERILSELRSRSSGASGRLGFRTARGWWRATRVVRFRGGRGALALELATTDPDARRLALRVGRAGTGALRLSARVVGGPDGDVEAIGIGFAAPRRERYLGFGERSNAVSQRGRTVESYVGEGPFLEEDYPLVGPTIPPWGIRRRRDATYFPMPWLLSSRGHGVLVENDEVSRFRLGSDRRDAWSLEVDAPRMSLLVLGGNRPADALRSLTERIGRQPEPVAPWVLGPWFQTGHANEVPEELDYARRLRTGDAPVSVAETHMRYMPCGSDRGEEASERARTRAFHARGFAAVSYLREAICDRYQPLFDEAAAAGTFLRREDGSPYTFQAFVGGGTAQVGMIDFTTPAGDELHARLMQRPVDAGYDGWMEDYGEYAPPDSVGADGTPGSRLHNRYPVLYHRSGQRFAERQPRPIARFVRSGWTGVHRHAQIVWGGDPSTSWGFDGLRSSVTPALTMGLSGISTWGSDVGGFFTLTGPPLTRELLHRWIQFGAVSGVMRTKAEGIGVSADDRPQIWEPQTLPLWRRYAKLRTQLYPYLVAADATYRRTGVPIMRHLALSFPGDARAVAQDDEFMFGPDLLAAPVLDPGRRTRRAYLPRGAWIDLWRSARYERRSGGLRLGRSRVLRGQRAVRLPAPLRELPLLVRAGAVLGLLPPDVDTLASYGERGSAVRLADRRDRMELLAFPRGRTVSRMGRRGRLASVESPGRWTLAVRDGRRRTYRLQASLSTLRRPFRPRAVLLDGRPLPRSRWSWDRRSGVLRASFRTRSGRLTVLGPHRALPRGLG